MDNKLLGVVLCGGESSRMGTDKGLMEIKGIKWAQNAYNLLKLLEIQVVVSINKGQIVAYSRLFSESELIVDNLNIPGPLKGILSVHNNFLSEDLFILPCDLIKMSVILLKKLKEKYESNYTENNLFAYSINSHIEPLFGIYKVNLISEILIKYYNNCLYNYSLQSVIKNSTPYTLPLLKEELICVKNHNCFIDLK